MASPAGALETTTRADGMADAGHLWPVVVCDRAHCYGGGYYRLVGFDIPEKDDLAHCDSERQFPARATAADRIAGTRRYNFGRALLYLDLYLDPADRPLLTEKDLICVRCFR
ncbi:hypothetical protein V4R08_10865 [Nitrobacter sp. NHB1]|uniref:hypothetical protein n=1 Tax=Nitrobacter sp. NHB1 TaxID=3119830 RepID=UPI002FFDA692